MITVTQFLNLNLTNPSIRQSASGMILSRNDSVIFAFNFVSIREIRVALVAPLSSMKSVKSVVTPAFVCIPELKALGNSTSIPAAVSRVNSTKFD